MDDMTRQPIAVCANCGSSDVRLDRVRLALWQDDRLVVVEDIPALVCGSCKEPSYEDTTVMGLDLLRGEGFPAGKASREMRVPVFSFHDAIAAKVRA